MIPEIKRICMVMMISRKEKKRKEKKRKEKKRKEKDSSAIGTKEKPLQE
jgi:hypothetical protein